MKRKKGNMQWTIIISLILALVVLLSYSFFTQGIVYSVLEDIGGVESDLNESMGCVVEPGTEGDTTGDGVRNVPECEHLLR